MTSRGKARGVPRIGLLVICLALLVWSVLPIYNMVKLALSPYAQMYDADIWPRTSTAGAFTSVFTQSNYSITMIWRQFLNSLVVAATTSGLVISIGTLCSFSVDRLRPQWGVHLSTVALATYALPMAFLAIPLFKVMAEYGLLDSPWSLILAEVAWCTPYGIWVFTQYSNQSIPRSIDESGRIDGAGSWRIYWHLYLPLMRPVLVAIGAYAFVHAWNEYLLAFILLNSDTNFTVPVALAGFMNTDQPAVNVLMAASIVYSLPPLVIYVLFQRRVTTGLTGGAVKG